MSKAYLTRRKRPLVALQDIDLDVADGEFVSIVGPSGCGKTTLLNILAGIDDASTGSVEIFTDAGGASAEGGDGGESNGRRVGARRARKPNRRGYVFQRDSVLPWRTVRQNVELGLLPLRLTKEERARRVREWLGAVGLEGFEDVYPAQLSGGMRKRVALTTVFAHDPAIFFMDEPFAAVDAQTRLQLQKELLELWHGKKRTVLFVTHDIEEAISLSDRVVVMRARPGSVLAEHRVGLARPRRLEEIRFDPAFGELFTQIWAELGPGDETVG